MAIRNACSEFNKKRITALCCNPLIYLVDGINRTRLISSCFYLFLLIGIFLGYTTGYRLQAAGLFLAVFALNSLAVRDGLGLLAFGRVGGCTDRAL